MYGEADKARKLGLTGDALRAHREAFIGPIANDFETWRDAAEPTLLSSICGLC